MITSDFYTPTTRNVIRAIDNTRTDARRYDYAVTIVGDVSVECAVVGSRTWWCLTVIDNPQEYAVFSDFDATVNALASALVN